jgi:hypothetical protein
MFVALLLVARAAPASSEPVQACTGPASTRVATPAEVTAFFKTQGKTVLTFLGYSGAGYQDPQAMLDAARSVLAPLDAKQVIVNIGATTDGVGAIYEMAKARGFTTTGIVSTQARDAKATISPCADYVFFVPDDTWGGFIDGRRLSPTSEAMVGVSRTIVAIGGGEVSRDEFAAAERAGLATRFIPADMNHRIAQERAQRRGEPEPADFSGAVAAARRGKPKE